MTLPSYWEKATSSGLAQGDHLVDCLVLQYSETVATDELPEATASPCDLIVVTQSCDLENSKVDHVACCQIYSLAEFKALNVKFQQRQMLEELRKGRVEGLHLLGSQSNPTDNSTALVVNFRQIFSVPLRYAQAVGQQPSERFRLRSPFLEHFSQAFARFFMRVGLPGAIPEFR